jgi:alkylhydroperoxidase family enzyme
MPNRPVRLPPLDKSQWTEETRDFFGALYGPQAREAGTTFNMPMTFARHPQVALAIFEFSRKVQEAAEITPRLREIVIMRVAWLNQTDYEWGHHHRYMLNLGMGQEHVQGIKDGPDALVWSAAESAAIRAVDELTQTRELTDATWAALNANYPVKQIIDILVLLGQYTLLALPFNAVGLRLEDEFAEHSMDRG